ncbi:MAG: DUF4189 domain-containing protein [Gaiellaceae bacterium]
MARTRNRRLGVDFAFYTRPIDRGWGRWDDRPLVPSSGTRPKCPAPYRLRGHRVAQYHGYEYAEAYRLRHRRWGAIAYSDTTGAVGYSCGEDDQRAAERNALQQCGRADARVVKVAVGDVYLAFARGNTRAWAARSNANRVWAEHEALSACQGLDASAQIMAVFHASLCGT